MSLTDGAGRCINLERPDLALEFTEDRLQCTDELACLKAANDE